MNISGINTYGCVIKANDTNDSSKSSSTYEINHNYSLSQVAKYSIEADILDLNKYEDFNMENSIQKIKPYLNPTIFSNSNHNNLLFEFKSGAVCMMGWSKKYNRDYIYNLTPDGGKKVSKISADENNENIVIVITF